LIVFLVRKSWLQKSRPVVNIHSTLVQSLLTSLFFTATLRRSNCPQSCYYKYDCCFRSKVTGRSRPSSSPSSFRLLYASSSSSDTRHGSLHTNAWDRLRGRGL
jgi:hypothetical protein